MVAGVESSIVKNVIIIGPTGVGKSALAESMSDNIEIVNADVGQLYTVFNIGTAKPNWRNSPIPHHMFDIVDEPIDFTVGDYRRQLLKTIAEINARGNKAVIVGGSHFYVQSILYPPYDLPQSEYEGGSWQDLYNIDPERANKIHAHDQYRINRALALYHTTGKKPSEYEPVYQPPWPYELVIAEREREDLYGRIKERLDVMLEEGWYQEAQTLKGTKWEQFAKYKGLIGYSELMSTDDPETVKEAILNKTWRYAKRQQTFIKALVKKLSLEDAHISWVKL